MAEFEVDERVDITDVVCPMTFVKAKVAMEELEIGQVSALLYGKQIETVAEVMQELTEGYRRAWDALKE